MSNIVTFKFEKNNFSDIKKYKFGENWPVVYIIEDGKEVYIGETTSLYNRSNQHYEIEKKKRLSKIHVITDKEYNKSASLDIESSLIQYMAADELFILQNGNKGIQNHNYFNRKKYKDKFKKIWNNLREMSPPLAKKEEAEIENSDLFKYSPYKSLSGDQVVVMEKILKEIEIGNNFSFVVHGGPGTGKTILAVYLFKRLIEEEKNKNLKLALVIPMTSLRNTLKKVFKNIKGLKSNMVIGPSEAVRGYDLLIVDEAHRLRRRKNIVNFKSFDLINKAFKSLGFHKESTELDWIYKRAKTKIFFYDENQSVRPSDIPGEAIKNLNAKEFKLNDQFRISPGFDGEDYINFVKDIFSNKKIISRNFNNYDFKIYDDIAGMVDDIKKKNSEYELCRMIAGYAWPWASKKDKTKYDIEINKVKLRWNSVNHNWVYSKNSLNEVGCIHTVQGYDLNYAGVIIGPELSYDLNKKEFIIFPKKYFDKNGKRGIEDHGELKKYILNIYKTLLTRGIMGTYIYIVDENLKKYFRSILK